MTVQHEDDSNIDNQIKEAANVLFRTQGYDNTSVTDFVEKMHIEKQIFFIYSQSMGNLLEVVWSES